METALLGVVRDEVKSCTTELTGKVRKVLKSSGAVCAAGSPTLLVDSLSEPRGIAIDANNGDVYYTEWAAGRIGKITGVQTTLASGLNHPFRLILDLQYIYFTETDSVL